MPLASCQTGRSIQSTLAPLPRAEDSSWAREHIGHEFTEWDSSVWRVIQFIGTPQQADRRLTNRLTRKKEPVYEPLFVARLIALCLAAWPAQAEIVNTSGRISTLRVHDAGTKYGPQNDQIDVEIVVTLHSQAGKAFGFQLRNDGNQAARRGMLDLLRDSLAANLPVSLDYDINPGRKNGNESPPTTT